MNEDGNLSIVLKKKQIRMILQVESPTCENPQWNTKKANLPKLGRSAF